MPQLTREEVQQMIDDAIQSHMHDGNQSQLVDMRNLAGTFKTVTSATDLTNTTATAARNIYEQIFIDTSTATKKLYIYDVVGQVWRSVAIA